MKRSDAEYYWMEGSKSQYKYKRPKLSPFFLRRPYEGTSADVKKHDTRGSK